MKSVLLVFLTTISVLSVSPVSGQDCKRRICYYDSSAQFRKAPEAQFLPKDIDTTLCSHIIYVRTELTDAGITPQQSTDLSNLTFVGGYELFTGLKQGKTNLKGLLALHVQPYNNAAFFSMADSDSSRRQFAAKAIQFLRTYRFDGLDVQFYIHTWNPGPAGTKDRILNFLETLRQAFDEDGTEYNRLLLAISVYGDKILDVETFDISKISENVDWITLLAYDFFGYWFHVTGHQTPLYADPNDPGFQSVTFNVDSAVRYWLDRGAPKDKIVVALSFMGRPYVLSGSNTGVGAPADDYYYSPYTNLFMGMSYFEICERRDYFPFDYHYLSKQGATYLVSKKLWISYDDLDSLKQKIGYIKAHGLGGFAAHSVDLDDFVGRFCRMGSFPLLRAANMVCTP